MALTDAMCAHPPRVMIYAPGGIGLGHLSRCVTLAGALRDVAPKAQLFVLTEAGDTRLAQDEHIAYLAVPPFVMLKRSDWAALGLERGVKVWTEVVRAAIETIRPHVFVYDTYIWRRLKEMVSAVGAAQVAVLRKARWNMYFLDGKSDRLWADMDLVVFPHLQQDYPDFQLPELDPAKVYFSGPLIRRTCSQLDPALLRVQYDIQPDDFVIVATDGGGNKRVPDAFGACVAAAVARLVTAQHRLRLILITGPLAPAASLPVVEGEWLTVREYEKYLPDLLAAANLVICRGGYNTINEVKNIGVPAICIPVGTTFDDQEERIISAGQTANVQIGTLDAEALSEKIARQLTQPKWQFVAVSEDQDEALVYKRALAKRLLAFAESFQTKGEVNEHGQARTSCA